MSGRSGREVRHDLGSMSRGQLLLRTLVVLSAGLFALLLSVVGDPGAAAIAITPLAGVLAAALPQTSWPAITLTYAVISWAVTAGEGSGVAVVPAALSLLVLHTACALAASVPAQAPLSREYAVLHGRRVGAVAVLTVGTGALVVSTASVRPPGGVLASVVALVVLAVALLVHYVLLAHWNGAPPSRRDAQARP